MEQKHVGSQARLFNEGLRKVTSLNLTLGHSTFVAINQTRSAIGQGPFLAEALPGGKGQQFFASIILRVMRGQWVKDGDDKVGFELRMKTEKNKLAPWPQECSIPFLFSGKFDIPSMILDLSIAKGLIKQEDKAHYIIGEERIFSRKAAIKYLGENEDSFNQHLQLDALPKINRGKIRDRQHQNHDIPDADIASNPDILKVITLLDVTIRFIAFPASQIVLHNPPDTLLAVSFNPATR
jgi:hypothetical protein